MSGAGAVGGASAAGRQARSAAPRRLAGKRRRPARSGGDRGGRQTPELEDVVGGGDELPFGGAGGQAASLEAVDPPQGLGVGEDRLDDLLAAAIKRLALGRVEDPFDALGLGPLTR